MKNPFSRFFRARDKPGATDSVSSAPTFYFGSSAAGKSVTASTAIQMSTVYACVRVIAETIASLPLHVYQNQGEGSVKALDHPLYPILHALEADGSIESYEQPGGAATAGKPRRYYRITRAGRGALEAQQTEWRRVSRAINAVLETMDARAGVVL